MPIAHQSLVETAQASVTFLLIESISYNKLLMITQHDSIPSCVLVMCRGCPTWRVTPSVALLLPHRPPLCICCLVTVLLS